MKQVYVLFGSTEYSPNNIIAIYETYEAANKDFHQWMTENEIAYAEGRKPQYEDIYILPYQLN